MEYWQSKRKLDTDQTRPIYDLSRYIASKLKNKDRNFRQTVEIAITEFFFEHDLEFKQYIPPETGGNDESVANPGEIGK